MWTLSPSTDVEKRLKKYQKKHRREMTNVFDNLDTFLKCLQAGASSTQIHRGFIHPEPSGVLAIDQKGKGSHLKEFRLYIYPDEESKTLHLITLGDKNTQPDDVQLCKRFVEGLRAAANLEPPHSDETTEPQDPPVS